MSESRTIVVTIIGTGVALGALLIGLVMNQNLRIDDLRGELTGQVDDLRSDLTGQVDDLRSDLTGQIDDLRSDLTGQIDDVKTEIRDMRTRLRNVQIDFGKVDQRLLTLERVIIPPAEPPE